MTTLSINHLRKTFPGVVANDDVNLHIAAGETHAILGENGAGKSTLIKMISGLYRPDSGEMLLNDKVVTFSSPREAIRAGIGVVHQHFMLIPALSVAENVVLGSEPGGFHFPKRLASQKVRELSLRAGLPLDPTTRVADLSVGMQQRVEIVKALYRQARILILDEPTAVLTPQETEDLFVVLRKLKEEGIPIVFISHKLDEVRAIADTVTVMRAGKTLHTQPIASASANELATMMVGREVSLNARTSASHPGDVTLKIRDLSVLDDRKLQAIKGVSFELRAGEILGVAGVDGNGQTELVEAIVGMRSAVSGSIHFAGQDITRDSVSTRIALGISYVPQDRQHDGLVLPFTLTENLMLRDLLPPYAKRGWLTPRSAESQSRELLARFDVRPPVPDATAQSLSGGNQQKVILAREVSRAPRLLIAVQPTRGLDVGAIESIHHELEKLRDQGSAILLVSLELDEILALSDRICVLHAGSIVVTLPGEGASRDTIGLAMTGTDPNAKEVLR
ncbi:ABC transporter ATP-binding protein [Ferroacidibacillus organovorans]|uniref:Heme ABC transporter ATP-binding protein n=1 Tax=Ferroacidibacillus organovorans TaxID=1765683 RepID=A0A162SDZ7_9BACL|nr:ABC transporter ATP-binding protein [Ferroacidibacillus organovorans]KYP79740.1 heme ABC transporter ATP-binding protein [Ferroacidibacillus organovorans]OAG90828.1 heme ABC transporter ATP-binding protein [Ferroacidibacillus organovorans]OPG15834.1 heme ABC transporter ATP-binding protein [Ferroacidibacillus organovorans]